MYNVCTIWKSYPSKTMAEMSDFWYFVLSLFYSVYTMVHNATHKEKSSTNTTGTFIVCTFFLCFPIWDLCYVDYCANSTGLADVKQINVTSGLDLHF